ncbi:unnamed protein product [Diatraea saccharalis]|uniref:dolichyl-phosphate-mannose--protein mannosyltransferase n=1 Tax=Diatraea saccharalis TaxID=40085 RepID=A0A9N9QLL2_9NEOP|nr:unnamed protein product [Diatraea saccharalis]
MASTLYKWAGLLFLSSFPYIFTLRGDFVFDDTEAIVKNKDVSSESWTDCFYNDFWGTNIKSNLSHKSYRPFTILTFRLNYIMNNRQLSALSFKTTNLFCHILSTVLVWFTYKIVVNIQHLKKHKIDISYFGALLFAVHPIHIEAISGIVGRADLLCGTTFFLAFICYDKAINSQKHSSLFMVVTIILSAVSMLFKENGVTVLGFCLFYDMIHNIKNKKETQIYKFCNKINMKRITILMLSIVFLLYGRWAIMGGTKPEFKATDNPAAFADSFTKVVTHSYIHFLNSLLFVWPQWLCYDWSMGCVPLIQKFLDHRILCPLLMYLYGIFIIRAIFCKQNKKFTKRILLLSVALIILPFLPAANIFYPVGFVIAERVLYIPSAGYCLMISFGLNKIITRFNKYKLGLIAYIILLLIYGLRSWQRSYDWQSEYQLFVNGMLVCPLNAKIHYNIAKVSDARNKTDVALASYKEAIRLYPEYYQAMNNLANLLKNQKKYQDAEYYLRSALKYKQDYPAVWMNLGIVLASTKRLKESEQAYKIALQYRKNYPDCYYNIGNLYLEMKKSENALDNWLKAINFNRKHELAWTNMIALLDNTGL